MIGKGKISHLVGDKAVVIPFNMDNATTFPLMIPPILAEANCLCAGTNVVYAMFDDNTGVVLEALGKYDIPTGGSVDCFEYVQETPSTEWTIVHNLGKMPSIVVKDADGSQVIGEYEYIDGNTVILRFSSAISGRACLN